MVLTSREHVIALEPRGKGLIGTLLRYPYEVRDEKEYFDDIPDLKLEGDARPRRAHRDDEVRPFRAGEIRGPLRDGAQGHREAQEGQQDRGAGGSPPSKVINLMDALRWSVKAEQQQPARKQQGKRGRQAHRGPEGNAVPDSRCR